MTIEETNKLLDLLNKNKLEQLREYLENQKIQHFNLKRQETFEDYMDCRNYEQHPVFYEDKENRKIIFSNRYSLYYVNSSYLNANSLRIQRNSCGGRVNFECIQKMEDHVLLNYVTNLIEAEFFTVPIKR